MKERLDFTAFSTRNSHGGLICRMFPLLQEAKKNPNSNKALFFVSVPPNSIFFPLLPSHVIHALTKITSPLNDVICTINLLNTEMLVFFVEMFSDPFEGLLANMTLHNTLNPNETIITHLNYHKCEESFEKRRYLPD